LVLASPSWQPAEKSEIGRKRCGVLARDESGVNAEEVRRRWCAAEGGKRKSKSRSKMEVLEMRKCVTCDV
jgi:hypothetical protein